MGFNTTVVVLNDALDQIQKDPDFGKNLASAIYEIHRRDGRRDVSSGNFCNAASVIASEHADCVQVVAVGGNHGTVLDRNFNGGHHYTPEDRVQVLKHLADAMGFRLVKKSSKTSKAKNREIDNG